MHRPLASLPSALCLLLAMMAMVSPLAASPLNDALIAIRTQDYARAYALLKPLAGGGEREERKRLWWTSLKGTCV